MEKTGEELWNELIDHIADGVARCIDTGAPFRASFGTENRSVTVDVYTSKASMKIFDEAALGVAKGHRGIDLAKGPK